MMLMTRAALEKLRTLIQEHPDDPIVRVAVRDLDETRLSFTITLAYLPWPGKIKFRIFDAF